MPSDDFTEEMQRRARRARRKPLFDHDALAQTVNAAKGDLHLILPHRGSFLLLDGVSRVDKDKRRGAGMLSLDPDDPVFADHFPGDPVYPGVLLIEAMAQLSLATRTILSGQQDVPKSIRFLKVQEASFVDGARPGDEITLLSEEIDDNGYTFTAIAQVLRGNSVVALAIVEAMEIEGEE